MGVLELSYPGIPQLGFLKSPESVKLVLSCDGFRYEAIHFIFGVYFELFVFI